MQDLDLTSFIDTARLVGLSENEKSGLRGDVMRYATKVVQSTEITHEDGATADRFASEAGALGLSGDEKATLKENVLAFMRQHPTHVAGMASVTAADSPWWRSFASPAIYMPITACLLLVTAIGTSWAATGAQPGQALYGMKTNLIEPVLLGLAASPGEKARRHATMAVERLREAAGLNDFDQTEERAMLRERFAEHMAGYRRHMNDLAEQGSHDAVIAIDADTSAKLTEQLEVYNTLEGEFVARDASAMAGLIELALLEGENARTDAALANALTTTDANAEDATELRRKAAVQHVATLRSFVRRRSAAIEPQIRTKVDGALKQADEALTQAQRKILSGAPEDATPLIDAGNAATLEAVGYVKAAN